MGRIVRQHSPPFGGKLFQLTAHTIDVDCVVPPLGANLSTSGFQGRELPLSVFECRQQAVKLSPLRDGRN